MKKSTSSFSTLRGLLKYIKKQWLYLIISLIATAFNVLLTLYIPILVGEAIDNLIGIGMVNFELIKNLIIQVIIITISVALLQWLVSIINNIITYKVIKDIRISAFQKLQSLSLKTIDQKAQGELVNLIITDIQVIGDGLLMGFSGFFSGIITIIGTIILMFTINVWITLVVIVLTPISLFVARFISKRTYSMFKLQANDRGRQTNLIDEMISNLETVKSLHQEQLVINRFNETNDALCKSSLKSIFFSSLVNPSTRFVNSLVYAAVVITSAFLIITNAYPISVGNLSTLLSYANQYTKPFNEISGIISELQNALACANRVFNFINEPDQEPDPDPATILDTPKGNINIENVYFSYHPDQKLIQNFNLKVKKGEKIAIVGPTGCGKTTLINLLMRFYDINSGTIHIDGINIMNMTRKNLRLSYGMVLQDTWLRNDTIRNNLVLDNQNITDEELKAICKICHVHSFVKRMPKGYDTIISENGGMLSTGQKQLLCIARVMLSNPPMLILDEATSNIDTKTEKNINEAFLHLMEGKTTFIVAHRLSTIVNADCILVMKDGKIIEQGKHQELIKQNGFYTQLYNSQFQK